MDYTPQYPVPKDLIFDKEHLERILIALLRADMAVVLDMSRDKTIWLELGGQGWIYSNRSIPSALDEAISKLPDNLRWKFFEEYDKAR